MATWSAAIPASAAFLDRDGVINVDVDYLHRVEDCIFVEGVARAIARIRATGRKIIVVTNQSGVARGMYGLGDLDRLHAFMRARLAAEGAMIDAFYACPHHPEGAVAAFRMVCECRKPRPGMILRAMEEHAIGRAGSFMIGDRQSDMEAARAAGIPGHLFSGGDLDVFVREILKGG